MKKYLIETGKEGFQCIIYGFGFGLGMNIAFNYPKKTNIYKK